MCSEALDAGIILPFWLYYWKLKQISGVALNILQKFDQISEYLLLSKKTVNIYVV